MSEPNIDDVMKQMNMKSFTDVQAAQPDANEVDDFNRRVEEANRLIMGMQDGSVDMAEVDNMLAAKAELEEKKNAVRDREKREKEAKAAEREAKAEDAEVEKERIQGRVDEMKEHLAKRRQRLSNWEQYRMVNPPKPNVDTFSSDYSVWVMW